MESQFTNQENRGQEYAYYYSAPNMTVEDAPNPENRKYGLGRAITAQVLSSVSALLGIISMYILLLSMYGFAGDADVVGASALVYGVFITIGCVVMSIVSIVLGVRSIKCFKKKIPRPIATLILGISSVVEAASALELAIFNELFMFMALIIAAASSI